MVENDHIKRAKRVTSLRGKHEDDFPVHENRCSKLREQQSKGISPTDKGTENSSLVVAQNKAAGMTLKRQLGMWYRQRDLIVERMSRSQVLAHRCLLKLEQRQKEIAEKQRESERRLLEAVQNDNEDVKPESTAAAAAAAAATIASVNPRYFEHFPKITDALGQRNDDEQAALENGPGYAVLPAVTTVDSPAETRATLSDDENIGVPTWNIPLTTKSGEYLSGAITNEKLQKETRQEESGSPGSKADVSGMLGKPRLAEPRKSVYANYQKDLGGNIVSTKLPYRRKTFERPQHVDRRKRRKLLRQEEAVQASFNEKINALAKRIDNMYTPSLAEEKAAAALGLAVMEEYGGMWRYFVTQWRGTKFVAPYHAQIGIRDMI